MIPMQIASRHFPLSEAEERTVRRAAEVLNGCTNRILDCRVTIEMPHRRWRTGAKHHVRIDLRLPGERMVVTRQADANFLTAVQDAFAAARRQVTDHPGRLAAGG